MSEATKQLTELDVRLEEFKLRAELVESIMTKALDDTRKLQMIDMGLKTGVAFVALSGLFYVTHRIYNRIDQERLNTTQ